LYRGQYNSLPVATATRIVPITYSGPATLSLLALGGLALIRRPVQKGPFL
jgi:hypothetical protein